MIEPPHPKEQAVDVDFETYHQTQNIDQNINAVSHSVDAPYNAENHKFASSSSTAKNDNVNNNLESEVNDSNGRPSNRSTDFQQKNIISRAQSSNFSEQNNEQEKDRNRFISANNANNNNDDTTTSDDSDEDMIYKPKIKIKNLDEVQKTEVTDQQLKSFTAGFKLAPLGKNNHRRPHNSGGNASASGATGRNRSSSTDSSSDDSDVMREKIRLTNKNGERPATANPILLSGQQPARPTSRPPSRPLNKPLRTAPTPTSCLGFGKVLLV